MLFQEQNGVGGTKQCLLLWEGGLNEEYERSKQPCTIEESSQSTSFRSFRGLPFVDYLIVYKVLLESVELLHDWTGQ